MPPCEPRACPRAVRWFLPSQNAVRIIRRIHRQLMETIVMPQINRQLVLASRPQGAVTPDNFRLVETPLAPLADGELRVRNHFLSLDPYMRGRMNDSKSYAAPQPLNEVMIGGTVGEVVESKNPKFAVG